MPPTLRLSVPVAHSNYELGRDDYGTPSSSEPDLDYSSSSSASGLDDDISSSGSDNNDQQSDQVRSPTRLVYNLDALPEKTKTTVREAFHEPPAMVVQHCRQVDDTFAFQMSEVVTRSVRIRAPSSGPARLSCSCSQNNKTDSNSKEPCHHILWLLDQLVKQTLYDTDHEQPLTMTAAGYPEEMGDPFRAIADHHLNIVADGLHCRHVDEGCYDPRQDNTHRMRESRELLSSIHGTSPDTFRPDLFDEPLPSPPLAKPQDLDHTILRMLVDEDNLFHYFLTEESRGSTVLQQFRLLTHRINAVFQDFDQHNAVTGEPKKTGSRHTVAWAARHIQGVVNLVRYAIWSGTRPLTAAEKTAAARTLIHVLDCVLKRRRADDAGHLFFQRFLGGADTGFVLDELEMIPEGARLYLRSLEAMVHRLAEQEEVMPAYLLRFRKFVAQLKASGPPPSLKRESPSDDDEEEQGTCKRRR